MVGISYIEKANEYHTEDFKFTCAQLSLDEDVPDDSFLKEVNHIYHNASNLLCSASCPCGLRDGLDGRMLSEFDNNGDDELDHLRQLRVFKEAEGATSVDKCGHYLQKVFNDDEDKQWQFQDVLEEMEEDNQCSGICNGIEDAPADFFLFSNVNDGVPQKSCRDALIDIVDDHIWYFHKLYLVVAVFSGIMMSVIVLLLFCQCCLYFRKKCCGKKSDNKKKKRADNGMVLGGEDQDNPDQGGVEVADTGSQSNKV